MAEKVGTAAEMPRLTSRQQHRSNAEAQTPRENFQRNVSIPLLDHNHYQVTRRAVFAFGKSCHITTWPHSKCSLFTF